MEKELQGLEVGSKAKLHQDSLRTILKRYQNEKHQAMIVYLNTYLKNPFLPWQILAIEMNRCIEDTDIFEWMTKKTSPWSNPPRKKRTASYHYRAVTGLPMMWKIQHK